VLFGVLLVGFLLMQVVPTDPAIVRAGPIGIARALSVSPRLIVCDGPVSPRRKCSPP
jgi:hypothetical protein